MIYIDLNEYLLLDREDRRKHLNLELPCIEIGGDSRLYRGLLAHHLNTTIDNRKALVCHACHNPKCSNPKHLYWGTNKDNWIDQNDNGTWKHVNDRMKAKYSHEEYKTILSIAGSKGGKIGGGHNKLDNATIRQRMCDVTDDLIERGKISRLAKKWNCSHTQVRRFLNSHALL